MANQTGLASNTWGLLQRLVYRGPPPFVNIALKHDLRPPSFFIFRELDQPRTMSEIAAALHCDNSNVTGLIDRLEEKGLVDRQPAEHDRRVKLLELTAKGKRLREQMMRAVAQPPDWLAKLSAKDQRALREVLERALDADPSSA